MEGYRPYKVRIARAGKYAVAYGYRPANPFAGALAGGRASYNPARRGYGRGAYRRRAAPIVPGYTRRVGNYGRFGTGRGLYAQIEKKSYDTTLALGASAGVASVSQATGLLNLTIPNNTQNGGRVGYKIIIKSIQVKLNCVLAAGATDNDLAHCWLIQDTQANGAAPAITDVFVAGPVIGNQLRNLENGSRFRILKHFTFKMNADAGVAAAFGGDLQQDECFIKCNIPIVYNSTAGAIGEIRSNNLFMIYGSTVGVVTWGGAARLRYTDM